MLSLKIIRYLKREFSEMERSNLITPFQHQAILSHFEGKYKRGKKMLYRFFFFSFIGLAATIVVLILYLKLH